MTSARGDEAVKKNPYDRIARWFKVLGVLIVIAAGLWLIIGTAIAGVMMYGWTAPFVGLGMLTAIVAVVLFVTWASLTVDEWWRARAQAWDKKKGGNR